MANSRIRRYVPGSDGLEKPRLTGVTEIRGPYYSVAGQDYLQHLMLSSGHSIDGIKISGGSFSLMPKETVKRITDLAHQHGIYVSTGGWADHVLKKGPSFFKQYVQDCCDLGFDTVELSTKFLSLQEQSLLRLIRLVKAAGLKAKPELLFEVTESKVVNGEVQGMIRLAERCLESGADMIMVESEGITKNISPWRTDVIADIVERIGLEKTMFEAADPSVFEWFLKKYGPKVNLLVDHSHALQLERHRASTRTTKLTRRHP